jgi:hypothetical protein
LGPIQYSSRPVCRNCGLPWPVQDALKKNTEFFAAERLLLEATSKNEAREAVFLKIRVYLHKKRGRLMF